VESLAGVETRDSVDGSGVVVPLRLGRLEIVPEGAVDAEAERARLRAALAAAERELARADGQLANPRFVDRAPAAKVQAEREKARRFRGEAEELRRRLAALGA
jgi:valyl-tRNA synthetase